MVFVQKQFSFLLFFIFPLGILYSQACDSLSIVHRTIRASQTESGIPWELSGHQVLYHPTCASKGKLLLYLVGSFDGTINSYKFTTLAASLGYHVIILNYPNNVAARTACGNSADQNCYAKFREEILFGQDLSSAVDVDSINSVNNRLYRLLEYLSTNYNSENWGQFLSGNEVNWSKLLVAGHSQGGGHAAYLGKLKSLDRIIMFASPNDYSDYYNAPAPWTSSSFSSAGSAFFGFNNMLDEVVPFSKQMEVWNNLPFIYTDTLSVIGASSPFNNLQKLYTVYSGSGSSSVNHSAVVRDPETPLDEQGKPIYTDVWTYLLGENTSVNLNQIRNDFLKISTYQGGLTLYNLKGTGRVKLFSMSGQLMYFEECNNESIQLNVSPGIYLLQVEVGGQISRKKVLVL